MRMVCLGVLIYRGWGIGLELFGYYENGEVVGKGERM